MKIREAESIELASASMDAWWKQKLRAIIPTAIMTTLELNSEYETTTLRQLFDKLRNCTFMNIDKKRTRDYIETLVPNLATNRTVASNNRTWKKRIIDVDNDKPSEPKEDLNSVIVRQQQLLQLQQQLLRQQQQVYAPGTGNAASNFLEAVHNPYNSNDCARTRTDVYHRKDYEPRQIDYEPRRTENNQKFTERNRNFNDYERNRNFNDYEPRRSDYSRKTPEYNRNFDKLPPPPRL